MSKAGSRIIASARQALAFASGEENEGFVAHIPKSINVRAVRRKSGLSQALFAQRVGVPIGTLRNWEQKRREPDGPARVLLALLARNPDIVEETLARGA